MSVAKQVRLLAQHWRRRFGLRPSQINQGSCRIFAWELAARLPGSFVIWCEEWDHAYVRYQGRLYDAETPRGVARYTHLPEIRRQKRGL